MKSNLRVLLSSLLCISLGTAGTGTQAELLNADFAASTERNRVQAALQRPDIRARLNAQGIDATEAEARVVAGVVYVVIKLLPLILIGGGTMAAIKASNRGG